MGKPKNCLESFGNQTKTGETKKNSYDLLYSIFTLLW